MVAVINSGTSIRGAFLYNESKVQEGVADCLMAVNYPMDLEDMTEKMRLNMLLKMAERNPAVKRNCIHISLNFAPEEQHSREFLKELAQEYMDRIGFGDQPFLLYQHYDSGHPHVHILTTTVRHDGIRIETNNIGKILSEPARKEMEIKYGLVKAEDHKKELFQPKAINPAVVQYGKVSSKRAISSILSSVLNSYKYTSLAELNALLQLYNVTAQRGDEDSRMYKNKGLTYRIINKEGKPISTPIKASAFHQKALLKDIEARFLRNDVERQKHKAKARVTIDKCLRTSVAGIEKLAGILKKEGIDLVLRRNKDGFIYGVTCIDHRTKSIFNGSDLGKQFSAAAILERCRQNEVQSETHIISNIREKVNNKEEKHKQQTHNPHNDPSQGSGPEQKGNAEKTLIEQLMQAEYSSNYLPFELRKSPKKKKKKSKHL
ncbi:Relaxase/Mobilisation nuclease domain-containing protein [Mucilaginibacter pineti]|uniref:Relaxase/Mobilisation nuclease domain-containing protein n=1 Tax=Mucilaginibacter pineti TaxID=1391627 RepID=A0A1G7GD74_9SPHI|nr:relaxase/mobilization nuclease domain-containing protein [Mucilaginibacter pineti]SDE86090.1 Relaxase/Mobilisation nuclease domain-containing protein [Mucilaginibacter pineti]